MLLFRDPDVDFFFGTFAECWHWHNKPCRYIRCKKVIIILVDSLDIFRLTPCLVRSYGLTRNCCFNPQYIMQHSASAEGLYYGNSQLEYRSLWVINIFYNWVMARAIFQEAGIGTTPALNLM